MEDEIKELSDLFRKLGANDPENWAHSQVAEGIPQLANYLFLREAWRQIVAAGDRTWIESYVRSFEKDPKGPYGGVGWALKRLQAKGATADELSHLVRGMQAELLFGFCYLLEDPGELEEEVSGTHWTLFLLDDDGRPVSPMYGLHEAVLGTDPTGNEAGLGAIPD